MTNTPTDLTAWTIDVLTDDDEKASRLTWPSLRDAFDDTPIDDLAGITIEDYAGALARARAITATTLYLVLELPTDERPPSSRRYTYLGEEDPDGAPTLDVVGMPAKKLRHLVERAEEMIDIPIDLDGTALLEDVVSEHRQHRNERNQVNERVRAIGGDDRKLHEYLRLNLDAIDKNPEQFPDQHAAKMAWLDQFEADVRQHQAALVAGAQPPTEGVVADYRRWWEAERDELADAQREVAQQQFVAAQERRSLQEERERLQQMSARLRERERQVGTRERLHAQEVEKMKREPDGAA